MDKKKTAVKASVCVRERATLLGHITLKPRSQSVEVWINTFFKTAVKASVCFRERATLLGHITLKR